MTPKTYIYIKRTLSIIQKNSFTPCRLEVEYAYRFSACRMGRMKGCPYGSTSIAWYYAVLLCTLYRDADPKRYQHSQNSFPIPPNHLYTWCNMLLTGLHHSPPPPLNFLALGFFAVGQFAVKTKKKT